MWSGVFTLQKRWRSRRRLREKRVGGVADAQEGVAKFHRLEGAAKPPNT